jgi:hypothetical protein
MQLSLPLLLCLKDFKAEQKECDDFVIIHASGLLGARHRTPRLFVSVPDKNNLSR